jgi:hypothetical protein
VSKLHVPQWNLYPDRKLTRKKINLTSISKNFAGKENRAEVETLTST